MRTRPCPWSDCKGAAGTQTSPAADFGLADFASPVDETGALSVRAVSARRCPDSEDTDASFTPTELRSVDADLRVLGERIGEAVSDITINAVILKRRAFLSGVHGESHKTVTFA